MEATVALHRELGPARTTISAIAERAGVQRLTVYRHFPDERALYQACGGHWNVAHPRPDTAPWLAIEDPAERLQLALGEIYAYFRATEDMTANIRARSPRAAGAAGGRRTVAALLAGGSGAARARLGGARPAARARSSAVDRAMPSTSRPGAPWPRQGNLGRLGGRRADWCAWRAPVAQAAKSAVAMAASGLPANVPMATPRPMRCRLRIRMMRAVGRRVHPEAGRCPRASVAAGAPGDVLAHERAVEVPADAVVEGLVGRVVLEVWRASMSAECSRARRAQRGAELEARQTVLAPDLVQELEDDALGAAAERCLACARCSRPAGAACSPSGAGAMRAGRRTQA